MRRSDSSGWGAALLVSALWAVGPLLPAILAGQIPGSPWTDLYPSVWGLGWFVDQQPGLPLHTTSLAAPAGMPFYYSSPLHGWAATPLAALGGVGFAYTVTLVLARFATVAVCFGALRAGGLGAAGALCGAAVYGASPFFHGFAVEGIVEGTDGWPLPLWAWMVWRDRRVAAALALALAVVASWYHGMVVCFLAVGWGFARRAAWASLLGLLLTVPFLIGFAGAAGGASPLPDAIRRQMGSPLTWPDSALLTDVPGGNPFALTAWVGGLPAVLAALGLVRDRRRAGWALAVAACAYMSLGWGPVYHLPVLEQVRFPYRWHAGTLFALAVLAGAAADHVNRKVLAVLVVVEGLVFSPIEPMLLGADPTVPALYDRVTGPILLDLPGPVAVPPGQVNRSRPRARYLLHHQLHHGAASPWAPDFNGIAATPAAEWLASFASWDRLVGGSPVPPDLAGARAAGVRQIMVHRRELGANAPPLEAALVAGGARLEGEADDLALYAL